MTQPAGVSAARRLLPFLWRSLWRNRRRSVLTLLGVAVAIFVVTSIGAAVAGMTFPVREVGADRLLKTREKSRANVIASRLPQGFEERVAEVPGVAGATGVLSGLAILGEERVHVFVHGVDPERYREVRDLEVDPGAWQAFLEEPGAGLVGHRLLRRMGWEVGDDVEVPMLGLHLRIVGVVPEQGVDLESHLLVQRSSLQVARQAEQQVSYVLVEPADEADPIALGAAIDAALATSPAPTETATAAAFAEAVIEDFMGFVKYLVIMRWITVLVTVLAAANAIAMSVRERTREIGIFKALGFSPGLVSTLVLLEATALAVLGGALGVLLAALAIGSTAGELAGFQLTATDALQGLVAALVVGVAGGALPAAAAARLRPIEALRLLD